MNTTATLRNGRGEFAPLVAGTLIALQALLEQEPVAFYDLVMKCREPAYQFFGNAREKLQQRSLVQPDATVHSSIRNIVLSAVTGDGLDMTLHSPYRTPTPD